MSMQQGFASSLLASLQSQSRIVRSEYLFRTVKVPVIYYGLIDKESGSIGKFMLLSFVSVSFQHEMAESRIYLYKEGEEKF